MTTVRDIRKTTSGTGAHVLASVTSGIEEFIEKHGARADHVMARGGFEAGLSKAPTRQILMRDFCKVLDGAVRDTGNDRFGLWFGNQFTPEAFGILGYLTISSPTLGEALRNFEQAFPAHQSESYFKVTRDGDICRLDYQLRDGSILNRSQDAELSIGMFYNILKQPLGDRWAPLEVHFEHARPTSIGDYHRAFCCDVCFDQPFNSILFRASALDQAMPKADSILNAVLRDAVRGLPQKSTQPVSIFNVARNEIVDLLKSGYPRLEDLAERMHLPPWTLQRRLASEGHSFKTLVDDVRQELALVMLSEPALSISELAFRLGYSEVSAFSRAFLRWHGVSPRHWRKVHLSTPKLQ